MDAEQFEAGQQARITLMLNRETAKLAALKNEPNHVLIREALRIFPSLMRSLEETECVGEEALSNEAAVTLFEKGFRLVNQDKTQWTSYDSDEHGSMSQMEFRDPTGLTTSVEDGDPMPLILRAAAGLLLRGVAPDTDAHLYALSEGERALAECQANP